MHRYRTPGIDQCTIELSVREKGMLMIRIILLLVIALLSAPSIAADTAKDYPTRPVRFINPFPRAAAAIPLAACSPMH